MFRIIYARVVRIITKFYYHSIVTHSHFFSGKETRRTINLLIGTRTVIYIRTYSRTDCFMIRTHASRGFST